MPTRFVNEDALRVAPELLGTPLASPIRRILAFVLDVLLLVLPNLAFIFAAGTLWLRLSDRPAFDALRTFGTPGSSPEAVERAAPDFARLLVRIDAPGLPSTVELAVEEGQIEDAARIVADKYGDVQVALTGGQGTAKPQPGQIVVPYERLLPGPVRALILVGVPALYFITMTWLLGWTVGKRVMGIRVRSLEGERVPLVEAFERLAGLLHIPALLFWPLAYLWTDPNRQLPHDRVARTVVVRVPGGAAKPKPSPAPEEIDPPPAAAETEPGAQERAEPPDEDARAPAAPDS